MKKDFEREKKWLLDEKYDGEYPNKKTGCRSKISDFSTDVKRLEKGEPLAYVIGFVDFLNCKIDLFFRPLIPRSETEFWVDVFIKDSKQDFAKQNPVKKKKILDIFSGSGCIGISLLKNLENISVDFAEKNPTFIKQIKKNLKLNFTKSDSKKSILGKVLEHSLLKTRFENARVFKSDVFSKIPVPKNEKDKYDFIFANPPYIPKKANQKVEKSVKDFEDYDSLFAEDNGLFFIKKLILESSKFLKKGGELFIEFDETSKKDIEKFLKEKTIKKYKFKKDQYGNDRLLIIEK